MPAATPSSQPRARLGRARILDQAMADADAGGLDAVSMRKLADELGVAPMALYRHVKNREDLIDGLIDLVFAEVELSATTGDWRPAMQARAISLRDALVRHRWAIGLMESRRHPGAANLRHHDAVVGSLRAGGFDVAQAAHAYSLLDSYVYGFALTRLNLPFQTSEQIGEVAEVMLAPFPADAYPNLAAMVEHALKPGYDYGDEFEVGLDLILDTMTRLPRPGAGRAARRGTKSGTQKKRPSSLRR